MWVLWDDVALGPAATRSAGYEGGNVAGEYRHISMAIDTVMGRMENWMALNKA